MNVFLKRFACAFLALGSLAPVVAADNPWLVRARAVNLDWKNEATDVVLAANVQAKNKTIPEVDITYFFDKNFAAELVLTSPQSVEISAAGVNIGSVKALPPSILLQYHMTNFGNTRPYVGAGFNYTIFSNRNNLNSGAVKVENSSLGYVVQVGVDHMFDKHWGVNLDVKYAQIRTDIMTDAGAKLGVLTLNPVMAGIGLTYKY